VIAVVAASTVGVPLSAQADADPFSSVACAAVPAAIAPGSTITFSCADGTFSPFESVLVIVEGDAGAGMGSPELVASSTRSTASGAISVPITLPSDASGTYDIAAASSTSFGGDTMVISKSADGAAEPSLGRGGWIVGIWLGGGLLVLAGCAIAVEASVRRNRRHHERLTP
jgi:hypothetical protein